jgi:hypothetical protein
MLNFRQGLWARSIGLLVVAASVCGMDPLTARAADNPPQAPKIAASREDWRAAMEALPTPVLGCFTSSYPRIEWRQAVCVKAPQRPYPPALSAGSQLIGNGNDVSGHMKTLITTARGSFPRVTGVTSEVGDVDGSPPKVANTYSLQLNTDFFTTVACHGASGCQGWQQFVYSSSQGLAFMQYWLISYLGAKNASCPSGWIEYSSDCYTNSQATSVNGGQRLPISQLIDLSLKGAAVAGGNDTFKLNAGLVAYSVTGLDSVVDLASAWHAAEFNIVGDCCSTRAVFNAGAYVKVEIVINPGNATAPTCLAEGFTGETNNLYFVKNPTHEVVGSPPAIHFLEGGAATTASACAAATSVGD